MAHTSSLAHRLSVLTVQLTPRVEGSSSWPVVTFLVDGREPFTAAGSEWSGFEPHEILRGESPLLPVDGGRRVAVQRCSCGIAGCGVVAPFIAPSPDGKRVTWVDHRDFVGVFTLPTTASVAHREGRRLPLPDLHFDRAQYVAEVDRAVRAWGR
ncbi:hypothetical protein [Oerskovia sp. KBS0722]|uniref:hypothetical protein n=1 Tax=Oerskovia sp. KBS0722 TaxID=1179673 RepID=UPI00110ED30A|nr:hypothetical protein [Oerskovia sp. KBS0722]QDW61997.1 hypothetical protein FFI11_005125 [Oerskovia sp. KBS0722]